MAISHRYHTDRARLALELTMRDALAGMEELANLDVSWFDSGCLEILGVEPPIAEPHPAGLPHRTEPPAKILSFPEKRLRTG